MLLKKEFLKYFIFFAFLKCLGSEETYNLIIINDFVKNLDLPNKNDAMYIDLYNALSNDDKSLILCTKHLLHRFQMLSNMQNIFLVKNIKNLELYLNILLMIAKYKIIIQQNKYLIKNVNEDYVLFIPKKIITQNIESAFNISNLDDYDFAFIPSTKTLNFLDYTPKIEDNLSKKDEEWLKNIQIMKQRIPLIKPGQFLILALNKIKPTNNNKSYINIFLIGHGSENMTAGISILKEYGGKKSDFEKLLHLLQHNFLIKSLTINSCYVSGTKNIDTFNITNPFDNQVLENISFPILTIGSFFNLTSVWDPITTIGNNFYKKYFDALNEIPPNYEKACKIAINFFPESSNLTHLASIKMPHTSWFSPQTFGEKMQNITQIQASIHDKFIINPNKNIILLSANYINTVIISENASNVLPKFFPVNYINQNYFIKSLKFNNQATSINIQNLAAMFLPLMRVEEPINIIVKNIYQNNDLIYKNVYFFYHKYDFFSLSKPYYFDKYVSGFFYTDKHEKTFINYWDFDDEFSTVQKSITMQNFEPSDFTKEILKSEINFIEQNNFTSQQNQNIEEIEKVITKKNSIFKLPKKQFDTQNFDNTLLESNWIKNPLTKKWQPQKTYHSYPEQNEDFFAPWTKRV